MLRSIATSVALVVQFKVGLLGRIQDRLVIEEKL